MISLLVLLPAVTALLLPLIPKENAVAVRYTALFGALAALGFALAILLSANGDRPEAAFFFVEEYRWVPSLGVSYKVGVDGISLFLVLLTALLAPIAILASWRSVERLREFHAILLLVEAGLLGAFVALDLALFFVFWEATLVPMYLLIAIRGGAGRARAAVKFFVYHVAGSLLMLLTILYIYFHVASAGAPDGVILDVEVVYAVLETRPIERVPQLVCFVALALGFAIAVPVFPLHTWLPDAHTEAPTAGSVILAGVFLKIGTYGFVRFAMPLFPEAAAAVGPWICVLAVVGIVYGALMCFVQDDIKRLIAWSSVSHLGFIVLGIFVYSREGGYAARAVAGSLLQMVNHGLSTGALFLLVGILHERRGARHVDDYGGVAAVAPRLSALFLIATLASIGLPFLNGFVGQFLILQGTFERSLVFGATATVGVMLTAICMIRLYSRLFLGEIRSSRVAAIDDLNGREVGYLLPLIVLMVWIGVRSTTLTDVISPSVEAWTRLVTP